MSHFTLHPRLEADTHFLADLPLCQVRVMNDRRFAWLVLVPRQADISEVYELSTADQARLWQEATTLGQGLMQTSAGDKLNLATLGNQVAQLHLHVIARRRDDAAWPAPVWGQGTPEPYDEDTLARLRERLRPLFEGNAPER
ncbi:HIT domain-containing protein [Halomonas shantousis]